MEGPRNIVRAVGVTKAFQLGNRVEQ